MKNLDIAKLYQTHGIMTAGAGNKHHREGWMQTACPFCSGNEGFHLGFNLENHYFNCWRCGFHPSNKAIAAILHIPIRQANKLIREYSGAYISKKDAVKAVKIKKKALKEPTNLKKILNGFNSPLIYMKKKRKFTEPQIRLLQKHYKLKCTGAVSSLDNINLRFRIFAPIIWEGKMVSWQTRDSTGKSPLKYIACPKVRELIHHKHVLYNPPERKEVVILVEGIFDVWKLFLSGYPATCGFGVELKTEQILLLKKYKKVILFLDPDRAGQRKEKDIFKTLLFAGVNVAEVLNPFGVDAGDMTEKQINHVLKDHF